MAKRSNGEGSVRQRVDGRWEARLAYTDPRTGTTRRASFYGAKASEARAKMREALRRIEAGSPPVDDKMTVSAWCRHWTATTLVSSSRKGTTKELYERLSRVHLEPAPFGQLPLDRLRPSHIEALIVALRGKRLADATVQRVFVVLRLALDGAVRDELLARNPASLVAQPSAAKKEASFLSPPQVLALLSHLQGSRYYPVLRLIATTGIRKGEALGLRWSDLDLETGVLTVRGTLARVEGRLVVTHPKTARSRRALPLAVPEVEMLREHRTVQAAERTHAGEMWHDDDFVFTSETGRPMDPRNVLRALTTAARRSDIEGVNVHTLRHSAATAWLEAGVNIKAVSSLLGHADIRVTANIYGHVSDQVAVAAMNTLSALLASGPHAQDEHQ